MRLLLKNTAEGLKPMFDDDYEAKRKLKIGGVYKAEVRPARNYRFLRKYFAMINCAWDLLTENQRNGLKGKDAFRKMVQMAAGHVEVIYSLKRKEYIEIPKSISFETLDEAAFEEVYKGVRKVIMDICLPHMTLEQFEQTLMNY